MLNIGDIYVFVNKMLHTGLLIVVNSGGKKLTKPESECM